MPLYEYLCDACGHQFEVICKFSDPPLEKCPVCGGAVHKLQSAPAIQFKGSGFYITDYAKKEHVAAAKADSALGAAAKGKNEGDGKSEKSGKTETKAETKTEKSETKTEAKADKASTTADTKSTDTKST
jgi:putative FmdB family regulatory protein